MMRRKAGFVWESLTWPQFSWDGGALLGPLAEARLKQGELRGLMAHAGLAESQLTEIAALTDEAVETSEIEGEILSRASVRSSVARRLGLPQAAVATEDARVEGVVELTIDATKHWDEPLTTKRLLGWHAMLFPLSVAEPSHMRIGTWRNDASGPMQVVSGRVDRPKVHFEAPPAAKIPSEIKRFLAWFEAAAQEDGLVRTGIAHFWFGTIHPFDDGNGRIARAIADMSLARDEKSGRRFYSMSRQIRREKADYYNELERGQRGDGDLTSWLAWFLRCYSRAVDEACATTREVLKAADFWRAHADVPISARQRRVLDRFMRGFEGNLTAKKWAALTKTSVDSAQRDIADLIAKGILARNEGGSKNTSYSLVGWKPAETQASGMEA